MIDLNDLSWRLEEHQIRVDRINHEAWKYQASAPTGTSRWRPMAAVGLMLQRIGGTLVHVGTRLQATRADHVARSAASRYTFDALR